MTAFREAFRRLGTPDAVTWTAFWVTLIAVTAGHFTVPQTGSVPARIAALLIAQVALFAPLLVLRWYLVRSPSGPHPWITVLAFAGAAAFRSYVMGVCLHLLAGAPSLSLANRLAVSFIPAFLPLIATALTVTTLRAYERDTRNLAEVRTSLEQASMLITEQIEKSNEAALERVRGRLNEEFARLDTSDDEEALETLRHLAGDVIRPMSHELAQSVPSWQPESTTVEASRVSWRRVVQSLGERGHFLPITTSVILVIIYAPSALVLNRPFAVHILLALLISIAVSLFLANVVLDRVLPLRSLAWSGTLVVVAALLAGTVSSIAAAIAIGGSRGLAVIPGGIVYLAGGALIGAALSSRAAAQQETAAELQSLTTQLAKRLVLLHQAQWYHQRSLSRALHGSMQSAVTAAAIRLDRALAEGEVSPQLLAEAQASIAQEIDVLGSTTRQPDSLDDVITRLTTMWSRVCTVDFAADDHVRDAISGDSVLRSTVTEIVTEAMSNAIRHGQAEHVSVLLTTSEPDVLVVRVDDDGRVSATAGGPGLGSAFLDDCTSSWESIASQDGHALVASLPFTSA